MKLHRAFRGPSSFAGVLLSALLLSPVFAPPASGEEIGGAGPVVREEKSGYHLFHPTPAASMREMSTDRPDKTESAYTVDAGHFQVEMDLVSYARDVDRSGGGNIRTEDWSVAAMNLKVGLLNCVDLQTIVESYRQVEVLDRSTGARTRNSGVGDVTSRLKVNLWGNDGGTTALAVMPFVKYPTSHGQLGNGSVEGGLILPLAVGLPGGFGLGVMTEFDWERNQGAGDRHVQFVNTATIGHSLVGKLGGYVEFFSSVGTESGTDWIGTVDLGFTYEFTDNFRLDAGINFGVTRSADDFNPFVGASWRF